MMSISKRSVATAVTGLALLGSTACGGQRTYVAGNPFATSTTAPAGSATSAGGGAQSGVAAGGTARPELLAAAVDRTTAAGSARFDLSMRMQVSDGTVMTVNGSGAYSNGGRQVGMELNLGQGGVPAMTVSEVMADGVVYVRIPAELNPSLAGKWMRVDTRLPQSAGGMGELGALGSGGPTGYLDALRSVTHEISDLGSESIDGVTTRHLRTTLDMDNLLGPNGTGLADLLRSAGGGGVDIGPIGVDLWIDGDGLPRRMTMAMTMSSAGQKMSLTMDMRLHDLGAQVDIILPDPALVIDQPLLGRPA